MPESLKRVRIIDFQSLHDVDLELGRFTVIVGPSDVGKSAVIRAIHSAVVNRSGQDFIRSGTKESKVALVFEDGVLAWLKGGSTTYKLGKKSFEKPGRTVPQEVAEFLRLGDIQVGEEKLNPNIHGQFQPPFLVTSSPGTRARLIGEMSGINTLYLAIAEANRRGQGAKRLQTTRIGDLEKERAELLNYSHLPSVQAGLSAVSKKLGAVQVKEKEAYELKLSTYALQEAERLVLETQMKAEKAAGLKEKVDRATILIEGIQGLQVSLLELQALTQAGLQGAITLGDLRRQRDEILKELEGITICPTCETALAPGHFMPEAQEAHA